MIRKGRVVKTEKDFVTVCFDREDMCGNCTGCDRSQQQTSVKVIGKAEEGRMVSVSLPDNKLVIMSAIMYLLPIVFLVVGLLLGKQYFTEEIEAFAVGMLSLIIGVLLVYFVDKKLRKNPKWQATIVEDDEK